MWDGYLAQPMFDTQAPIFATAAVDRFHHVEAQ